jgi:hypothetical protein
MIGHVALFIASPLSGFRAKPQVSQPEAGRRLRLWIGRITLFMVAVVVTAAAALSFPATTASDTCPTCVVSARVTPS